MEMTNGEIRTQYRQIKGTSNKRVKILAELNDVPQGTIRKILGLRARNIELRDRFLIFYNRGYKDKEIAKLMGRSYGSVNMYRRRLGLPVNRGGKN